MCYFSDEERRRSMYGRLEKEEIDHIAKAFFHRALKLQIGCGAEPTLSRHLPHLIRKGKEAGIPYISITTNGGLLTYNVLKEYVEAGLDEITLSCHGIKKETYEYFMQGGRYEHFVDLLKNIALLKKEYVTLNVRINYTMNEDNVAELKYLPELLDGIPINIMQIRPIQEIGKSDYNNFNVLGICSVYNQILEPLRLYCQTNGIICIMPDKENLIELHDTTNAADQYIENLLYCNISPQSWWHGDFDRKTDTFESYCKRHRWTANILAHIIHPTKSSTRNEVTKKMNYTIN